MLKETEIIKEIIDIFSREKMNIQSQCKAGLFDDNKYWENIIRYLMNTEDLYAYKKGPSLLLFIIIIIIQVKNMDLDFRQDGCMFMINWFNWSNQTD